jgi:hypothetical protein
LYYKSGFHVFEKLEDAIQSHKTWAFFRNKLIIFKVKLDYIVASGIQNEKQIFVCRKMKILKEVA